MDQRFPEVIVMEGMVAGILDQRFPEIFLMEGMMVGIFDQRLPEIPASWSKVSLSSSLPRATTAAS